MRILSVSGQVGYGFDLSAFNKALDLGVDYIASDAGSMDPGPYYLGHGEAFVSEQAFKRDLEIMVKSGLKHNCPVVVGSSGGGGGEPHLRWSAEILEEIARENNLSFKSAVIHAEVGKEYLHQKNKENKIQPLGPIPPLSADEIDNS